MLRSERNGDCWNNLTSLDMYISANSMHCHKRQLGVIMKRFRRIIIYAQKFTLVLSRQVYPSHAFSFCYIFLAKSHTNPSCGRFYAGNDPRHNTIIRINHSDKRQPLLPILLLSRFRKPVNKSDYHYYYFCLAAAIFWVSQSCFFRANLERLVQLRSKVTPRCRNKV
ncbi:hypothetical protein ALC53_13904 [Atta colombica]|uniref:Uncharacterized protein n=1 Tax=Atta colombica TaxID=520822 RepID=A0A195AV39_9HYME|nr:hypothetical protein ALC53_13904 [Atta colombica]